MIRRVPPAEPRSETLLDHLDAVLEAQVVPQPAAGGAGGGGGETEEEEGEEEEEEEEVGGAGDRTHLARMGKKRLLSVAWSRLD